MTDADRARYLELSTKSTPLSHKECEELEYYERQLEHEPKMEQFKRNQAAPYEEKLSRAANLAWEFYNKMEGQCYVAVGGLDSITLYLFLRSIGIDVPAVSVSALEDKSIQRVHIALGVQRLKPIRPKVQVIREFGWPVLSKELAGKISLLQNPSEKNATVRHAIITGETGAQGGWRKQSRMKMSQVWLEKFGGADQEGASLGYHKADFKVSDKCCYYLKEKPCNDYAKQSGRWPYMGLMASEGGRRQKALVTNGCNYISRTTKRSCPFATFSRQDILQLALEMDAWYKQHTELFPGPAVRTIVPDVYGCIERGLDGTLRTTKAQRTGCSMCGFGIHMERRPHRFDLLWERNPKEWDMWMQHVIQREDGSWYGWGHVLDYIGVDWREPWRALGTEKEKSAPGGRNTGKRD